MTSIPYPELRIVSPDPSFRLARRTGQVRIHPERRPVVIFGSLLLLMGVVGVAALAFFVISMLSKK